MSKVILSMLFAALVCVASSAKADESISTSTLSDMGLSGITVMSDSDALAIRGMGFRGGNGHIGRGCKNCGPRGKTDPYSRVSGSSHADIELDGQAEGDAHTQNTYFAEGPYAASGDNYSEAGAEVTNIEIVDIDGVVKSVTTTCAAKVWAGGSSFGNELLVEKADPDLGS